MAQVRFSHVKVLWYHSIPSFDKSKYLNVGVEDGRDMKFVIVWLRDLALNSDVITDGFNINNIFF